MKNPTESQLHAADLMNFLDESPCNFLAADAAARRLDKAGFRRLDLTEKWEIAPGGKYYVTKNGSALFAFIAGAGQPGEGFRIISAHSDSPGFRIKPNPEMVSDGALRLNTEVYGGPILYTWFDRPLSIAGRVVLRGADPLHPQCVNVRFTRPLLTIPHLAIHFNRKVNEGNPLSRQKDMLPVIALLDEQINSKGFLLNLVAKEIGREADDILDFDLTLYDITPAMLLGADNEFITSGRLDDLMMVHCALTAMMNSAGEECGMTRLVAIFDNEETGSGTKQGAASPLLRDIMTRINNALGGSCEDFLQTIASSFMISADNAHGIHPNYPEKHDPTNHPVLGGGPVIKINADCKYMTDAESSAVFRSICDKAGVPCQYFVNRSDSAGGSTLGNKLTVQLDLRGVDMGVAQWAMHSVRETAAIADAIYTTNAFHAFFTD